jgi:hypothetical protein
MARSTPMRIGWPWHMWSAAFPYYSVSFFMLVVPLLLMVTVGRRLVKGKKKATRTKVKAIAVRRSTRSNPTPVVRGAYREWDDHAMECALSELAECADYKNAHLNVNITKTAETWGIPRKTLARYFYNPGCLDNHEGRRILSDDDEKEIVQCILTQHAAGMALTHTQVKWLIMEIVKKVDRKADTKTGKAWIANNQPCYTWYRRFLDRHSDKIRSRVVENLDPKRWKVSFDDVKSLYIIMDELRKKYPDLPAANIANLDETNLTPERRKSRVLAAKGAKRTHSLCNDARFSMTALPVIFADGTQMPPHFIIKGQRRPQWWGSREYCIELADTEFANATLSVQENGWMDSMIFLTWFQEYFLPFTANRRSKTSPVILILDNFSGHVHPATLRVASDNDVIMVGLPPHSTHITQPLDVCLMKPLKDYWKRMLEERQVQNPWDKYKEQDVIKLLCKPTPSLGVRPGHPAMFWSPWSKAFTPSNIRSSFRKTGVWPVDFSLVEDLVYEMTREKTHTPHDEGAHALEEAAPSLEVNAPCEARSPLEIVPSSMASARTATEFEGDNVVNVGGTSMHSSERASNTCNQGMSEETMIEQRILKNQRALEEDIRHLELLRLKRGAVEEWRVHTNAICASISNAERPTKRTRSDATGRTEALVLNGLEQLVAAEARLKLRQNKKEMKLKIRQARKEAKLASMAFASLCKDLKKAAMDVGKLQQSCATFAAKNSDCSVKRAATTTSAQAQKASEKAQVIFQGMAAKLPCISEAMRVALDRKAQLSQAEDELKQLEDSARNVQDQAAEEEEEEDDDDDVAHVPITDEVAIKYEVAMADFDEARNASNSANAYANKAALNALLAVAREAWIRAVAPPARGRGSGSRGGDRGRNMHISATTVTTTPLSPVVVAPFDA